MARRMTGEPTSACYHAEADRPLNVVAGVNFGEKRVERTKCLMGDDGEARRTKLPSETAGREKGRTAGDGEGNKVDTIWVFDPDGEGGMRPAPEPTRYSPRSRARRTTCTRHPPLRDGPPRELPTLRFALEDVGAALRGGPDWLPRLYGSRFQTRSGSSTSPTPPWTAPTPCSRYPAPD